MSKIIDFSGDSIPIQDSSGEGGRSAGNGLHVYNVRNSLSALTLKNKIAQGGINIFSHIIICGYVCVPFFEIFPTTKEVTSLTTR